MRLHVLAALAAGLVVPASLVGACSDNPPVSQLDAGPLPDNAAPDMGQPDQVTPDSGNTDGGGCMLASATIPAQNAAQPGQLLLTASGEILAITGYNFPAVNSGDPVFADGWEVRFDHMIATFDHVKLWNDPDKVPTDQSQVGTQVAQVDGPWAVDLSQNGAGWPYIDGKEQGERAVVFGLLTNENMNGGAAFPTDGTRLAVGFSATVATCGAKNVNLGPDGLKRYQQMIDNGCVVLYTGTAHWNGNAGSGVCTAPGAGCDAGNCGLGQEAEFTKIPTDVNFDLCFKPHTGSLKSGDTETDWINCDNQDNDPAPPLGTEPHQRGIAFKSNTYSVGEVTFHTDHPFWESTKHDTPAHFDQFAAQIVGVDAGGAVPTVHFEDTIGVDYTGFKDKQGGVLPWRICDPAYQNPSGHGVVGQMSFDPVAVPHCTGNDSSNGFCDYRDFSKYDQSTQGHWNGADGLCFVKRAYPSPQ